MKLVSRSKDALIYMVGFIFFAVLYEYMVLYFKNDFDVSLMIFVYSIIILLFDAKADRLRKCNKLFLIMLSIIPFIQLIRQIYYSLSIMDFLDVIMLEVALFIFSTVSVKMFKMIFLSSIIGVIPVLTHWAHAVLINHANFLGNRYGLTFSMVALISLYFLAEKNAKLIIISIVVAISTTLLFISNSRTAVIIYIIGVAVYIMLKLTQKSKTIVQVVFKILFLVAIIVIIVLVIQAKYDALYEYFFQKWGVTASSDSMAVRKTFWVDIFSHNTFIGLEPNYMISKYGVENSHDSFVQSYLMFGWVLFFLYIMYNAWALIRPVLSKCKNETLLYYILIIPMTFMAYSECNFFMDKTYPFFGILFVSVIGQMVMRADIKIKDKYHLKKDLNENSTT